MATESIVISSRRLADHGLKIAVAESATAGWLASEFALTPNSGDIFLGGIICYDAESKKTFFNVSQEILDEFTPESAEVTRIIAERLCRHFKCDVAIAITGLTTPGGSESEEKPVGTMFIHISLPEARYCAHREIFTGSPENIIANVIDRTGKLLTSLLDDKKDDAPVDTTAVNPSNKIIKNMPGNL